MNHSVSISNIPFSKLINTRDLGGLPTKDGKTIKPNTFLRGASLYQLVPSDGEKLVQDYHVAFDIDLRIDKELYRQPDTPLMGVTYHHYQLREDVLENFNRRVGEPIGKMVARMPTMGDLYLNMVSKENSIEALKNIFRVFFDEVVPDKKSALFHCTEGKDRTGIVAALLEDLLGVPREVIFNDYMLSNESFQRRNDFYYTVTRVAFHNKQTADSFRDMYQANEVMLQNMFDFLDSTYGGTEGFFVQTLGFTPAEIADFKQKVLE